MKNISKIITAVLVFSCFNQIFTHDPIHDRLKKAEAIEEQQEKDSIKANFLGKLLGATIAAAFIGAVSRHNKLKDTAFGTGLLVSTIPTFLALMAPDQKTGKAIGSMAVAAPIVGMIGGSLVSEIVCGPNGILNRAAYLNMDKLADIIFKQKPTQAVAALIAIGSVGAYIPAKKLIDRITNTVVNASDGAINYANSIINN